MVKSNELHRGMIAGNYPIRSEAFSIKRRSFVLVRCSCGKLKSERTDHLNRQNDCRCLYTVRGVGDERHPLHLTYRSWTKMRERCLNPNHTHHEHYGGRGITICDRWLNSFEAFVEDMGTRPSKRHSIDRIDNDRGYSPDNCKWSTAKEQNRNKTNGRRVTWNGRTLSVTEWAEETGIDRFVIYNRLDRGWGTAAALTYPNKPRRRYITPPQHEYAP